VRLGALAPAQLLVIGSVLQKTACLGLSKDACNFVKFLDLATAFTVA
jgi:hypothetical protein